MDASSIPPGRPARAIAALTLLLAAAGGLRLLALAGACLAPRAQEAPPSETLDLARDPPWKLAFVPGIGPARGREIARLRERGTRVGALEDLVRVRGIGPVTVRRIARACAEAGILLRARPASQAPP